MNFRINAFNHCIAALCRQKHGIRDLNVYKTKQWASDVTNITAPELWNLATFSLDELITKVKVTTWTGLEVVALERMGHSNVSLRYINVKGQRGRREGQCYTLLINDTLKEMQIKTVMIEW